MPETYGKTLVLRTPHTRVTELGENKLVLILKPLLHKLALILLEGSMHHTGEEN